MAGVASYLSSLEIMTNFQEMQKMRRKYLMSGIERFRYAAKMVLLLLKAVGIKPRRVTRSHYNFLSWTIVYDEVLGISRLNYNQEGLTFDPEDFKAKKEATISPEVKDILKKPSEERTEQHIRSVILYFQNFLPSFGEFPLKIQQSMLKMCTYDKFESGRVIIRQGHRAENFYFILSGCAVVTEMETGDNYVHTTNILGKGNSFGELAFLNMSQRSATVTCREDVELLCLEREDYINIFMRKVTDKQPEHITFLSTVEMFNSWPVEKLPWDNPRVCATTFVRRGVTLCQDSCHSDWVIVVMSGTCKILKALTLVPKNFTKSSAKHRVTSEVLSTYTHRQRSQNISSRRRQRHHRNPMTQSFNAEESLIRSLTPTLTRQSITDKLSCQQGEKHQNIIEDIYFEKHVLPSIKEAKEPKQAKGTLHLSPSRNGDAHTHKLARNKPFCPSTNCHPQTVTSDGQTDVFIEIVKLRSGDVFGIEDVVMKGMRDVTSCSLVSDGAEVILIDKKFFRKYLTQETTKQLRLMVHPLPSEKVLRQNLQTLKSWEAYKATTLLNTGVRGSKQRLMASAIGS